MALLLCMFSVWAGFRALCLGVKFAACNFNSNADSKKFCWQPKVTVKKSAAEKFPKSRTFAVFCGWQYLWFSFLQRHLLHNTSHRRVVGCSENLMLEPLRGQLPHPWIKSVWCWCWRSETGCEKEQTSVGRTAETISQFFLSFFL